jgi:lysophospholipase L1-like esterase
MLESMPGMSSLTHKEFRQGNGNLWLRRMVLGFPMLFCLILVSPNPPSPQIQLVSANSTRIKIMPLGDSITYGVGSSTGGGYRLQLWNDLRARGFAIDFVGSVLTGPASFDRENEGLPGWKINQIAAKVVNWLMTYRPSIILMHIGTNDIFKNDDPAQAPIRLSHLLNLITSTLPGVTVIVAQILPLLRSARLNAEVVAYNATIPRIVQAEVAQGKHVHYVDMYDAVPPSMLPDRIHPNDAGYAVMAKVWLYALLPLLAEKQPELSLSRSGSIQFFTTSL